MIKSYKYLVVFIFLALPLSAFAQPKIVIEQPKFNAGTVPQGQDIIHDFIIKNTGSEPLTVKAKPC